MGKRKRSQEVEWDDEISTKKAKLGNDDGKLGLDPSEVSPNFKKQNRSNTANNCNKLRMGMNRYVGMSYQKLQRIMARNADCGLHLVVENRHVTIGWHQLGEATNAIRYILNCSLGQYKKSLNGILLAIEKVDIIDKPLCIADQPCMHIDLNINCIVFCPEEGHSYNCVVTAVDKERNKIRNTGAFQARTKSVHKNMVESVMAVDTSRALYKDRLKQKVQPDTIAMQKG
uniref:Uncharacterized protein n=1 Tax=Setaria digitata TaxID=48799 RepID=A0A915PN06_9BILA